MADSLTQIRSIVKFSCLLFPLHVGTLGGFRRLRVYVVAHSSSSRAQGDCLTLGGDQDLKCALKSPPMMEGIKGTHACTVHSFCPHGPIMTHPSY